MTERNRSHALVGHTRLLVSARTEGRIPDTVRLVRISVVIPAHNEEERLGDQLDAVLGQQLEGDWEVIVVDNASIDGTADLVRRYGQTNPRIRLVIANEKADKSYAVNRAVEHTSADLVAFCDADDIVAEGWLAAIAAGLETFAVVTGPTEVNRLNQPWLAASRGRSGDAPVGSFAGLFPCIRGGSWGATRAAWDELGGLTEEFGECEDFEFSLRCQIHDIEIGGLPDAIVHYRYRDDIRSLWKQGFGYGSHRPMIARMLKDYGLPTPPKFSGWRSWVLLVLRLPTLVTRSGRFTWTWIAANRLGQVVGSVRFRTLML